MAVATTSAFESEPHRPRLASMFRRNRSVTTSSEVVTDAETAKDLNVSTTDLTDVEVGDPDPDDAAGDPDSADAAGAPDGQEEPVRDADETREPQDGASPATTGLRVVQLRTPDDESSHLLVAHSGGGRVEQIQVALSEPEASDDTGLGIDTPSSNLMAGEAFVVHLPHPASGTAVSVSWVQDGTPGQLLLDLLPGTEQQGEATSGEVTPASTDDPSESSVRGEDPPVIVP